MEDTKEVVQTVETAAVVAVEDVETAAADVKRDISDELEGHTYESAKAYLESKFRESLAAIEEFFGIETVPFTETDGLATTSEAAPVDTPAPVGDTPT